MAKIVVEKERLYAENWNRSNRHGRINPEDFTPDAKNPLLAWFFVNIGRADWMGSGIRNLYKYTKIYSGCEPELIEGDIFKTIIPIRSDTNGSDDLHGNTGQVTRQDTGQVGEQGNRIISLINFCSSPKSRKEMQEFIDIASREHFNKAFLVPLLDSGQLQMTIPDKPNSRNQKYVKV
jgi:ATP-dependent DNA helicase RecG